MGTAVFASTVAAISPKHLEHTAAHASARLRDDAVRREANGRREDNMYDERMLRSGRFEGLECGWLFIVWFAHEGPLTSCAAGPPKRASWRVSPTLKMPATRLERGPLNGSWLLGDRDLKFWALSGLGTFLVQHVTVEERYLG